MTASNHHEAVNGYSAVVAEGVGLGQKVSEPAQGQFAKIFSSLKYLKHIHISKWSCYTTLLPEEDTRIGILRWFMVVLNRHRVENQEAPGFSGLYHTEAGVKNRPVNGTISGHE